MVVVADVRTMSPAGVTLLAAPIPFADALCSDSSPGTNLGDLLGCPGADRPMGAFATLDIRD